MKNKTNLWPRAIIASFVLFALFIGYLVKELFAQEVDLVSDDYYGQAIRYEEQIDKHRNARDMGVLLDYDPLEKTLSLQVASSLLPARVHLSWVRPSDAAMDRQEEYVIRESLHVLNTADLPSGKWKVRAELETTKGICLAEKDYIQP